MKTWHAAIASFGTAAFLVAAYVAVLSVSGALFALTDLSRVSDAVVAPKLKTVVATKPVKVDVEPVVARVPRPEPEPEPAPEPEPQVVASTNLVEELPASPAPISRDRSTPSGRPDFQRPDRGNGGGGGGTPGTPSDESGGDGAALLSEDGVNASGSARHLTDEVNTALEGTTGGNLSGLTDRVVKVVDGLERGLGLDRQGR